MGTKKMGMNQIIGAAVVAAGFATSVGAATTKAPALPRGADVSELAGNCAIGAFPQTSKAGPYNSLCSTMQDAEKCLAYLKQHFNNDGSANKTQDVAKTQYCLEELADVLGAN